MSTRDKAIQLYQQYANKGMNTRKRYDKAQELARDAKYYYYTDAPWLTDEQYDILEIQIELFEQEFPEWVTPDSITQYVGYKR